MFFYVHRDITHPYGLSMVQVDREFAKICEDVCHCRYERMGNSSTVCKIRAMSPSFKYLPELRGISMS